MTLLGFDIGNTNTTMGIYLSNNSIPEKTYRFRTEHNITSDELGLKIIGLLNLFDNSLLSNKIEIAFSTVVSEVIPQYNNVAKEFFKTTALEINSNSKLNIKLNYTNPETLGADRIVNAVSAFKEYKGSCLIIDIGTAATFCVVLEDGTFDGGIIAPGIGTTIDALFNNTSQLPKIKFEKPDKLITTDTTNAIKSGFYYGWISLIEGMAKRIQKQYKDELKIIVTGGFANILHDELDIVSSFEPELTMKGIKYIYDLNK